MSATQNIRQTMIPYGRQWIDEDDIQAVVDVLRSDWLTTGPKVAEFEQAMAQFVGAREAVAVSSGTAALHCAMYAIGIGPGDEVILPPMTFAATANAVLFQGGTPVFADVDPDTLLIDPDQVEAKITGHTKAVIAVDYTGQPCDYDALRLLADKHHLVLIADACHSLGAEYKDRKVGTLADLTIFSFHPVKHITTGEGGMVVTDENKFAEKMRRFRNHGITSDHHQRQTQGSWFYEMVELGYNYRLSDLQCALGQRQLTKLPGWLKRRREIARCYDDAFAETPAIKPLGVNSDVYHAYHLYVCQIYPTKSNVDRDTIFKNMRAEGIGVNVHYIPVHLHPFYRNCLATNPGLCPVAETASESLISLPMFPELADQDIRVVISSLTKNN